MAGQSAALVNDIKPAEEIIRVMFQEAFQVTASLSGKITC